MAQNMLNKMTTEKYTRAALVIGGFHAEALRSALEAEGFEVVQITPLGGMTDNDSHYAAVVNLLHGPRLPIDAGTGFPQLPKYHQIRLNS